MAVTQQQQNGGGRTSLWDKKDVNDNLQVEEYKSDAAVQKIATAADEATRQAEAMKAIMESAVNAMEASKVQSKKTMNSAQSSVKKAREVQESVREEMIEGLPIAG